MHGKGQGNRKARLERLIREELALSLPTVKDPRVSNQLVTLTQVDLTPDHKEARVKFVLTGDDSKDARRCGEGLTSASGYFRRSLAKNLDLRTIPALIFKEDKGLSNSLRVHELLNTLSTPQ